MGRGAGEVVVGGSGGGGTLEGKDLLPLVLFWDYDCLSHLQYENTPIQIFRKFHLKKLKIFI